MSKYNNLWRYLEKDGRGLIVLTFDQIHVIVGCELDTSFYKYKKEAAEHGYMVTRISIPCRKVFFVATSIYK